MVERIVVGQMYTNAYIYSDWKKECILVDPGDDGEEIIRHLTLKNLTPRGIAFTHGHLDHIAGTAIILEFYREKDVTIPLAIHSEDQRYLGKRAKKIHQKNFRDLGLQGTDLFESLFSPVPDPDILLDEGDFLFDSDLVTVFTPGHTRGSVSFYSEKQGVLFSGDTLFFEGIGRTDLPEGDSEAIITSIKEKLYVLPPLTRVFPGHGPDTVLEREIKHNPFVSG